MLFAGHTVIMRGGGDIASGVVYRMHQAGFPIVVLELDQPLTIRRPVSVSTAVLDGFHRVERLAAIRIDTFADGLVEAQSGRIPVVVSPLLPDLPPSCPVVVDARLAKRNLDTTIEDAEFVVGLGPGFVAGENCHAVIETMRGHRLGRVILEGSASPDTGVPGVVGGESVKRVVRAVRSGRLQWVVKIGDPVSAGEQLGTIDGSPLASQIGGVVRGLLAEGVVSPGLKIADIDPRADRAACFEISDKSLAIGGGVLEAVLQWMNRSQ